MSRGGNLLPAALSSFHYGLERICSGLMFLRVRIRDGSPRNPPWRTGHKPLALAYSVALHVFLVALAFLPAPGIESDSVYRAAVVELEKDHKLIYYDFRKELPEVSPTDATAKRTTPGPDALKSKQQIVANPNEKPGKQLVYIPEPRVKLQSELQAPNLIAIAPEIPLPDRPKPKPFQAPERPKNAPPQLTPLPSAPSLSENAKPKDSELNALLHKPTGPPPKQFVPPPQKPDVAPGTPIALPNAPKVGPGTVDKNAAITALLDRPSGPPPKQFVAPAERPAAGAAKPGPLPNAPALSTSAAANNSAIAALLDRPAGAPVRPFTAPRGRPQNGGGGSAGAPQLPNAPAVGGGGQNPAAGGTEISGLFKGPSAPPPRPFTPPPSRSPGSGSNGAGSGAPALPAAPSAAGNGQPASATVAIIGLNPSNVPQIPKPEGSHPARIETGTPAPGATHAELGGGNPGIRVPGLSIQGGPATSPATASRTPLDRTGAQPATGLATPRAPQVLPTTPHMSVPQWPNTRHLPAAVERHFQNRVVYLTSIPSAQGSDDWIVWFAELQPTPPDPNVVMHPPILLKSAALPPFPAQTDHGSGSIRLTGVIGKDGHFSSLTELAGGAADRELIEALQSWEFSPARRNGVVTEADAVIEIPVVFGKLSLR
jgi:hypothetical protein